MYTQIYYYIHGKKGLSVFYKKQNTDYKVYVYIILVFSHLAVRLPQISRCVFASRLRFRINIPHAA